MLGRPETARVLRCPELGSCSLLVLGMFSSLLCMETGFYLFFYILFCEHGGGGTGICVPVCAIACGGQDNL